MAARLYCAPARPEAALAASLQTQFDPYVLSQVQLRQEQQKVTADFQRALELFQITSRRSAERQRLYVQEARARVEQEQDRLCVSGSFRRALLHVLTFSYTRFKGAECRLIRRAACRVVRRLLLPSKVGSEVMLTC